MHLILASTSRYRQELLARLGVPFTCQAPGVDEDAVKADRALGPRQVAEILAERKARAVAAQHPGAVVIGSDQLAHLDGDVLGKPGTAEGAEVQLARLAGRTHELVTAVCIIHPGGVERHTDLAQLSMRPLAAGAIARYVAADRPLDCAGAYKLECRGIALFSAVACADHTAITGLPLIWTAGVLGRLGIPIP
jgi:septum formation protein